MPLSLSHISWFFLHKLLKLLLCVSPPAFLPFLNQLISVNDQPMLAPVRATSVVLKPAWWVLSLISWNSCTLCCFIHVQLTINWHFSAISLALFLSLSLSPFIFLLYIWNQTTYLCLCYNLQQPIFLIGPSLLSFLFVIICCIGLKPSWLFAIIAFQNQLSHLVFSAIFSAQEVLGDHLLILECCLEIN